MTDKQDPGVNWDGVSEPMAREILRQAETYLQAQWQAAIAADQRAVTAASIFITTATAVAGGAIAYWTTSKPEIQVMIAGLVVAGFLITAAVLAFWSAQPVKFCAPGNEPMQWWPHMRGDIVECLGGETENLQRHIQSNHEVLAQRGRLFKKGFEIALAAPVIGAVYWLVVTFLF